MSNRVAGPASKTVVVVTGKAKTRLRQVYVAASFMIFPNTQLGRATALRRRLDGVGFRPTPLFLCPIKVRLASLFKNVTLTESDRRNGPPFTKHPRV